MGLITDIIFGRQIRISDPRIGELTARVKNTHPEFRYTWTSSFKIPGQGEMTIFILKGDSTGPFRDQLDSVYLIIDTLDKIVDSLDIEISGKQNVNSIFKKEWNRTYYLASVSTYEYKNRDNYKKFELSFEPLNDNSDDFIDLIWDNGKLSDIGIY